MYAKILEVGVALIISQSYNNSHFLKAKENVLLRSSLPWFINKIIFFLVEAIAQELSKFLWATSQLKLRKLFLAHLKASVVTYE